MGITYKALDTDLRCPVALKVINTHRFGGPTARDRFLHEARTAARLRHPNIASVFHLGVGEENCFYAMEYIEGETLESLVERDGALPWTTALNIFAQCARALQVAHAQNFIHRDIKPANIMLTAGGLSTGEPNLVKLIDFGLVKVLSDDAVGDLICESYFAGTPLYASPEQIDHGVADARSDIFSLGACLEYMLTGTAPNSPLVGTVPAVRVQSASRPASPQSTDVPVPIAALLASMLSSDPSARPQTADDLSRRISGCLTRIDPPGASGRGGSETQNTIRRKQRWLSVLSLLGVLVVVAIIVAEINRRSEHAAHRAGEISRSTPPVCAEAKALYAQGMEFYRKYNKEDMVRAIDCMSTATQLSPAYSEAYAMLGNFYFENVGRFSASADQIDLAVASVQRAIIADPNNAMGYQVLGAIRSYQRRPWEALSELHRALERDAKSAHAMCDFSLLWSVVGQPQWALPWAKAAAQLEPSKIGGWHAAAEASTDLGEYEQAENYYRRCTELQPVWTSAYCGLIHLHILRGDFDSARREYAKIDSIQPGLILPLTLKAQIALFAGDYADAETTYRRLVSMKRDGMVGYYGGISYLSALGYLRLRAGDITEGQALLEEAGKQHSADAEGPNDIYDLAAIRSVEKRTEASLLLLKQAVGSGWKDYRTIELDPRFDNVRGEQEFSLILEELRGHVAQLRAEAKTLCDGPIRLSDYPVRSPASSRVN